MCVVIYQNCSQELFPSEVCVIPTFPLSIFVLVLQFNCTHQRPNMMRNWSAMQMHSLCPLNLQKIAARNISLSLTKDLCVSGQETTRNSERSNHLRNGLNTSMSHMQARQAQDMQNLWFSFMQQQNQAMQGNSSFLPFSPKERNQACFGGTGWQNLM